MRNPAGKIAAGPLVVAAIVAFFSTQADAQEKLWKHGLINAKSDAGIFLMVSTRDFAKKQGLKIEISQFKDDQLALKALIATDKVTKVEDLKGRQIAVSAPNSMPDMLARSALAKFGVADTEVKLAAIGGDNDRYQALVGGVVDAAVVSNEYQPVAPKNIHLLVAGRDAVPNFLRVCMVSTAKKLAERGDDAVKFLAAEMSALRFALSHRDETIALTREITRAKPDDPRPAFVYDDAVQHNAVDPTLPLPAEKIQWIQDQMVKAGRLKAPLDLNAVTAPEYREKALQVVGH